MEPFTTHTGIVAVMDRANVDTDQIIPKQFLKRIERTGFGQFLFFDWRFLDGGAPDPKFELNREGFENASILVTQQNFGSGSSREHAVWALADFGIRSVIAPSFADIFFNNCFKNGVLPVTLSQAEIASLIELCQPAPQTMKIDLQTQTIVGPEGFDATFEIDSSRRHNLLHGLDDIALTLQHADDIDQYERDYPIADIASQA